MNTILFFTEPNYLENSGVNYFGNLYLIVLCSISGIGLLVDRMRKKRNQLSE